jgi:hypothetical protein
MKKRKADSDYVCRKRRKSGKAANQRKQAKLSEPKILPPPPPCPGLSRGECRSVWSAAMTQLQSSTPFPAPINSMILDFAGFHTSDDDGFNFPDNSPELSWLDPTQIKCEMVTYNQHDPQYGWRSVHSRHSYSSGIHVMVVKPNDYAWIGVSNTIIPMGRRSFVGCGPGSAGLRYGKNFGILFCDGGENKNLKYAERDQWSMTDSERIETEHRKGKIYCELDCNAWTVRWHIGSFWSVKYSIPANESYAFVISLVGTTVDLVPADCSHCYCAADL